MKHLTLYNSEFIEKLDAFRRRMRDQGRKPANCNGMTNHIREFFHYLEEHDIQSVKKITQKVVDDYLEHLSVRPNQRRPGILSASYINKHREALLRFVEFIEGKNIGESSFFIRYMDKENIERTVLTEEEVAAMFNMQDNSLIGLTNKTILALLYGGGLRRSELDTLEVQDIDMARGMIRLEQTKTKYHRDVPMSQVVQHHLEQYLYNAREIMLPKGSKESHLLITYRGRRMSIMTITYRLKKMAREAGLDKVVTPHVLRHSIATHLLGELTLEEVADFLGHRNLDSTQIYTHLKETIR